MWSTGAAVGTSLVRSNDGHLDLPRAREGGLIGGLFALFAKPEEAPEGDLTQTADGYEVRLAHALDPRLARQQIDAQLAAVKRLVERSEGQIRLATSISELEAARKVQAFSIVLHMEGAEAIDPKLDRLERLHAARLRSLGLVWSRPNNLWPRGTLRISPLARYRSRSFAAR